MREEIPRPRVNLHYQQHPTWRQCQFLSHFTKVIVFSLPDIPALVDCLIHGEEHIMESGT